MKSFLSVCPALITSIMLSISLEIMVASVTATRGGLSKSTISQSDSSFLTSLDILFVPSISEGFGGINPEVKIERLSISDFFTKER